MADYRDRKNYVAHSLNNLVVTLNGEHVIEGLDSFEAEYDEDEAAVQTVADGTGIMVEMAGRSGKMTIKFLEASASTDKLFEYLADRDWISVTALDPSATNYGVNSTYCRIVKRPPVKRGKEHDVPEWVLTTVYLNMVGGSYLLAT
ncbi:MAG: hypothetical protein GY869_11400 [Planctomycetes bacterium]|nr:hypothetical protein [Planctomycetota bacterium]